MNANEESRLVRLEETVYFQEEKLKALEEQLLVQRTELDDLARQIKETTRLTERLRDMMEGLQAPVNELPPHYQQRGW